MSFLLRSVVRFWAADEELPIEWGWMLLWKSSHDRRIERKGKTILEKSPCISSWGIVILITVKEPIPNKSRKSVYSDCMTSVRRQQLGHDAQ
jgi:hypothetical protein